MRVPHGLSLAALLLLSSNGCVAPSSRAASREGAAALTIHVNSVLQQTGSAFHGTNFVALWNPTGDSPGTKQAFAQMGCNLVRFPGGVPAHYYDWKEPLASGWTKLTPQSAWRLAQASGAGMIFQTNTRTDETKTDDKTGRTYSFDSSGSHAGEWARAMQAQMVGVVFWEIGNEPEQDAPPQVKDPVAKLPIQEQQTAIYDWYTRKFGEQARAIKKATPGAKIMGPASTNIYFWWALDNLGKFMAVHGNRGGTGLADAVSLHWYPEGGDLPWPQARSKAQDWEPAMKYVRDTIAKYDSRSLPVYVTEWNWGAGTKNDSNLRLANALGCADIVGMFLRTGVAGQTHFCLQNLKGWGVLAMQGDDVRPENEPNPTYFALAMTSRLHGAVLAVDNPFDEKNEISAYATRDAKGRIALLLVNKSESARTMTLRLDGASAASADLYTLAGETGNVKDTRVIFNGEANVRPASGPLPPPKRVSVTPSFQHTLPACSIAVLVFTPQTQAKSVR